MAGLLVWIAAVALPVVALPAVACADEGARAVLVVDTGDSVTRYCVALPDDEVTGLELIVLAGEQHGLTYRFGYGGAAVCMLADVGTTGDDCFERYPDFWGYWRGSSGGWTWSSTGAGNTSVRDGDVEGWSWGSGSDGSSHPRPPATRFASVCPVVASQKDERRRSRPRSGSEETSAQGSDPAPPSSARPVAAPTTAPAGDVAVPSTKGGEKRPAGKARGGSPDRDRRPSPDRMSQHDPPTIASEPAATAREGGDPDPGGMPPASGVAALGTAALLGGAGFVLTRRRRGRA